MSYTNLADPGRTREGAGDRFQLSGPAAAMGIDSEGAEMFSATQEELRRAQADGETINFNEAAARVIQKRRFAGK